MPVVKDYSTEAHYAVKAPLPDISLEDDKDMIREKMDKYATRNNFVLVAYKSSRDQFYLRCEKGGRYRNWRKLSPEDRKRHKCTIRQECPFKVKFFKRKNGAFYLVRPKGDDLCHNHPLEEDNLLSSCRGRKNNLTAEDIKKVTEAIDSNTPTTTIQKAINKDRVFHKLTIHDINNMKYSLRVKSDDTVKMEDDSCVTKS
ncbi:hypothetical protein BDB01DRAFT_853692 [Pilobolus umbonatus]|nr:hypothetical protein BDB01DRAFT_853692 [Pilobolus umbonatus]